VAALCGSLGAALSSMVANLTIGKKGLEESWDAMRPVADQGQELKDWLLYAVDEDTASFNRVMDAMRLPKSTPEEKQARQEAIEEATKDATRVPLSVLERSVDVMELAAQAAERGNQNSVSDSGVAALCARTCAEGAYLNVCINLDGIEDKAWSEKTLAQARELVAKARSRAQEIVGAVEKKVGGA
jgi:glutamate formiminotransferase/formiminotetrahydrofolate cyclodeaminase